jgi:hypothetical protein
VDRRPGVADGRERVGVGELDLDRQDVDTVAERPDRVGVVERRLDVIPDHRRGRRVG